MKKCTQKLFKKMVCLVMACAICSQLCGITAFAAQETTSWSLYFNPTKPSSENVTTWSRALIAYGPTSTFKITNISSGVKLLLSVPNATSGGGTCYLANHDYLIKVTQGYTYTYTVKYKENINAINNPYGTIKH